MSLCMLQSTVSGVTGNIGDSVPKRAELEVKYPVGKKQLLRGTEVNVQVMPLGPRIATLRTAQVILIGQFNKTVIETPYIDCCK